MKSNVDVMPRTFRWRLSSTDLQMIGKWLVPVNGPVPRERRSDGASQLLHFRLFKALSPTLEFLRRSWSLKASRLNK